MSRHRSIATKTAQAGVPVLRDTSSDPDMMIPCIDLQDGRAVQLVHGRERKLAVDDVFGLLELLWPPSANPRHRS